MANSTSLPVYPGALRGTAEGALGLRGTRPSGSSGFPLEPGRLGGPRDQGSQCSRCIKATLTSSHLNVLAIPGVISWMVRQYEAGSA